MEFLSLGALFLAIALAVSVYLSTWILPLISYQVAEWIEFIILFGLGIVKICGS